MTLASALDSSAPLAGLLGRLRDSRARLEAVASLLPPGLAGGVRAGPLDDRAWVLLVPNAASAAKVRQLLPALHDALQARGWAEPPIRIKVLPPV